MAKRTERQRWAEEIVQAVNDLQDLIARYPARDEEESDETLALMMGLDDLKFWAKDRC